MSYEMELMAADFRAAVDAVAVARGADAAAEAVKGHACEVADALHDLMPLLTEDQRDRVDAVFGSLLMCREVGADF